MDEIKQHFPTLELAFNKFVKEFGGDLVSELLPSNSANIPKNADYLFKANNIVAELKCLQNDPYTTEADRERLFKKINTRIQKGYLTEAEIGEKNGSQKIHESIYADVKRTLENIFRGAKKQIGVTKNHFQLFGAKGLLLLANDGNYFNQFSSDIFVHILKEHLFADQLLIDGFVFFVTNKVYDNESKRDSDAIWLVVTRDENDERLMEFGLGLGLKWAEFVCKETGIRMGPIEHWDKDDFEKKLAAVRIVAPKD
jgi:hypothetical protein